MRRTPLALLSVAALGLGSCADQPEPLAPSTTPASFSQSAADGEWIIVFNAGVADAPGLARDLVAAHGGTLRFTYQHALKGFAASLSESAVRAIGNNPNVAYVEADQPVFAVGTQSNATWGLDRSDQRANTLDGTYNYNTVGTGVDAYIIDTGIRLTHQDFGGRAVSGYDAVDGGSADDCNGHGTHVAGTVGGTTWGIAKAVNLVAVRVLDCQGSGTTSGVIAGVDWVTANHTPPSVANMSLGGGASTSLDDAVRNSIAAGVSYAIAAGNGDFIGRQQDACGYSPARVAEAMTIGATDKSDAKASWSNYGDCVDWFAPGVGIVSAWIDSDTDTDTISGTSMATPHVAGVAALYLETSPSASPQTVRDALYEATTKGIVTSSSTANNHLLYSLVAGSGGGGGTTNSAPTASFTFSCTELACDFDGTGSSDSDGTIGSYAWDFGDGATGSGATASHTYAGGGTYSVTLTVTDDAGATGTQTQSVAVSSTSGGAISLSATGYKVKGRIHVDLAWSGATSTSMDVYRNGAKIATTANDGAYTDATNYVGGGTLTYKVCEAGTATCSNDASVTF